MTGRMYGIGVGPGDPELLTLKAYRLIRACPVIAYPAPDQGDSFARRIVASFLADTKAEEMPIRIPMRVDRFPAQSVYDAAAETIAHRLDAGLDVAVLCEGDPFFYGSFMYLFQRLAETHAVEVVPGVTSLSACAAASSRPLCARNEVLSILPGPLPDDMLEARLRAGGAFAIMKVGRHLARLKALLDRLGATSRATYLGHATLPDQVVLPLDRAPAVAPYFSMILIAGTDPYAS